METSFRLAVRFSILLLLSAGGIACDSASETNDPTANLSGVVTNSDTQTPLENITVEFGASQTVTDQNGRYSFRGVQVGRSSLLRISSKGFEDYQQNIVVQAGENTRNVSLLRQTYYSYEGALGKIGVYFPPGIQSYRGAIFLVDPPQEADLDSRGFASGETTTPSPTINTFTTALRAQSLLLAEQHGLALMGAKIVDQQRYSTANFDNVLTALVQIADESLHPEIAQAPLLLIGLSRGGCYAYEFARKRGARIIGFMSQKGNCHQLGDAEEARSVPGYFFIGGADDQSRADNINQVFQDNRPGGALWAIAVERGAGHTPVSSDLFAIWMGAALQLRLPTTGTAGNPVVLNSMSEAAGWLGNRETFDVTAYASYDGDKSVASWLPSLQAAQEWHTLVSLTGVGKKVG